ncbi:hypothetical protein Nepgr_023198 [Nepenthes gracilis]|uniref:Uncharacterized protein n=1 Tax=Nepenthes gracilis TaxID=150966 RepID=A0AAD3T2E1_NEPGR|nr:hypothetical protein Nepgr_023198 [Nepenthes gracilis]
MQNESNNSCIQQETTAFKSPYCITMRRAASTAIASAYSQPQAVPRYCQHTTRPIHQPVQHQQAQLVHPTGDQYAIISMAAAAANSSSAFQNLPTTGAAKFS